MAKTKSRNKRLFKIIFTILCCFLILTISSNIMILFKINKINNEIKENQNKKTLIINKNKKEIIKYEEKIKKLNNLDKNIIKIKEETFTNIKLLEDKIQAGESNQKIIYITFDDGPYYLTYKVLDILKENDIKATFFLIGQNKQKCYDNKGVNCYEVLEKIAADGHTLANHTYSHAIFNGLYSNTTTFINNVKKQEELIKNYTGEITNIVRFPGGSKTAGRLKESIITELRKINYGWVDWTAQDGDGGELKNKDQAWNNFKNSIDNNIEVLLLHDYNQYTVDLLPNMITYLKENGYLILPLSYQSNMVNK